MVLALICLARPAVAQDVDLWLIGDSTVNNNVNGGVGWGNELSVHFDFTYPGFDVINRALAGRSSRTFWRDQFQSRVVDFPTSFGSDWGAGDYLLMQFGHNDGGTPTETNTASLPGIGEETVVVGSETVHTFGWYLRQYIQEARNVGAIPIIASRVPRAGDTNEMPSDYALWSQQVAQNEGVDFINLYTMVTGEYNDLRAVNSGNPNYIRETYFGPDATHTNELGAQLNADFVAQGILDLTGDAAGLKTYLLVPEPSTVALFGLAALLLFSGWRRRTR